jgi:hypothetical protein
MEVETVYPATRSETLIRNISRSLILTSYGLVRRLLFWSLQPSFTVAESARWSTSHGQ